MPTVATVSDKGQVTLPKPLRDQLGIVPGTQLRFTVEADGQLRVQVLARGAAGLFGLLARPGEQARSLAELDAGISSTVRERAARRR